MAFNSVSLKGSGIGVATFALSGVRSLRFGRSLVTEVVVRAPRVFLGCGVAGGVVGGVVGGVASFGGRGI